ncbi:serine--tRNA ligase [Roseibacillus ishigakijimensis]|uniref:Serine--tRNA ligase n=1 Tax=Roseibacillus ishigakijimensis TaxID=454146 RepID=A0A934RQW8_9BACT|nr:serine--tRNA ligase [Roseibacillus ishigakijimensis]MBK1832620.1 serine--tRNA ligase [Roseibacillus ishigakijimensis]
MLDIKLLRENPDLVKDRVRLRGGDAYTLVDQVLAFDETRRKAETEKQAYQSERKSLSKQIGALMGQGKTDEAEGIKEQVRVIGEKISALEAQSNEADEQQTALLLSIPNLPHEACPVGEDESANPVVREWGEKKELPEAKDHVQLAEALGLISFEDAVRIAGSGYAVYRGAGARLQRALIQYLLDLQTGTNGYEEVNVPHLINRECMFGTGQLPKFEDDMYGLNDGQTFLAPTAEVPVTNLYRETLLAESDLPIKMTAHTPCFRREAGSAGRDNKGIIRMHQFDKIELVQIAHPEQSMAILEELTGHAESVLQSLGLHYRVIELCTGDVGFSAAKTYDLEVWAPGQGKYLEVSSCSNFGDYQARRMRLRYKDGEGKNQFCHTLNGSGTALPRLMVALLEQYQNPDGSITLPEPLRPYFGGEVIAR